MYFIYSYIYTKESKIHDLQRRHAGELQELPAPQGQEELLEVRAPQGQEELQEVPAPQGQEELQEG